MLTCVYSYNQQIFGARNREPGHVDVELPKAFFERKDLLTNSFEDLLTILIHLASRRCVVTAGTIGSPISAAWYVMYLGATAVDTMCVRRGLKGVVDGLGIAASRLEYTNG